MYLKKQEFKGIIMSKKAITNVLPEVKGQYEEFPYPLRKVENEKRMFITTNGSRLDVVNHYCFKGIA